MLTLVSILVALGVGAAAVFLSRRYELTTSYGVRCELTRLEMVVVGLTVMLIVVGVTMIWGPQVARAQTAGGYREFWNGSLVEARAGTRTCTRDGSCAHEYKCDRYTETETYTVSVPNADGKGSHTETRTRTVTKYHACPYATRETTYVFDDSLGRTIVIGANWLDAQPEPFRATHGIPADLPRGVPQRWTEGRDSIAAGRAQPVTKVNEYTNFILPTEGELYKQFSGSVEKYQKAQLLPDHTALLYKNPMFGFDMQARKVMPVGRSLSGRDVDRWNERLMQFNAALGTLRQGDLHVVIVPADQVSNGDDYVNALVSYWQHDLGRWGFAKNGIAVVLGADRGRIEWARAKTGMPEGNGEMLTAVSLLLDGKRLEPDVVLGDVTASIEKGKPKFAGLDSGALGKIMFVDHPFQRACMNCKDDTDKGTGYVYLKDSLPISASARWAMFFLVLFLSSALWGIALYFDPVGYCTGRRSTPQSSRTYY